jgi:transposase-like protein
LRIPYDFYYEHTWDFISQTHYIITAKDFIHICADGKKKCYQINDTLEFVMLKTNPKCPSCGKSLLG